MINIDLLLRGSFSNNYVHPKVILTNIIEVLLLKTVVTQKNYKVVVFNQISFHSTSFAWFVSR